MIAIDRDRTARFASAGLTKYEPDEILAAAAEWNAAEEDYQAAVLEADSYLQEQRKAARLDDSPLWQFGLPDADQAIVRQLEIDNLSPDPGGHHRGDVFPIKKWARTVTTYRAAAHRIRAAIANAESAKPAVRA